MKYEEFEVGGVVNPFMFETEEQQKVKSAAEDLLDALLIALPYVEDALDNGGYKEALTKRAINKIRAAIHKATE